MLIFAEIFFFKNTPSQKSYFIICRLIYKDQYPQKLSQGYLNTLASIKATDEQIGHLLKELDNLTRDTIILFHSDNGGTMQGRDRK